ncbi:NAD-dependent epimerase/dehydratase family protein [Cryomorphaceae bacterium]|nr:NAD-dependent epimerase/dehydratase family protein [Cryomorphaceae bacterium]
MIFVTGGTGLVGSHLLYELAQVQNPGAPKIRALYRSEARKNHVLEVFELYSGSAQEQFDKIEWIRGDLSDLGVLEDAMRGVDLVYHCAALVSFDPRDRDRLFKVNEEGTANIVHTALACGVRKLAYVSSVAALGRSETGDKIDESTSWKSGPENSQYAISKYAAEQQVWKGTQEGLPAVMVNPSIILGPGFWEAGSSKIFSSIAGGFSFYSKGINGFVDVRDVTSALVTLASSDLENERFVLSAENRSYQEVFTWIAEGLGVRAPHINTPAWLGNVVWRIEWLRSRLTGKSPMVTKETAATAQQFVRYGSEKIKEEFGFTFRSLKETIQETAKHFPKN